MARHNPVLGRDKAFQPGGYATFNAPSPSAPQRGLGQSQYGRSAPNRQAEQSADPRHLEDMYSSPSATPTQMERMTYEDVTVRMGIMLGTIFIAAAITWFSPPAIQGTLMIVGLIGGFVLALVNIFKKKPVPALIVGYAALEGLFLGGISFFLQNNGIGVGSQPLDGLVFQAVLATFAVFAAVLLLFRSGKVRTSPKLNKIFFVAMFSYLIFGIVNLVLVGTGVLEGFGMRSGPLGVVIGLLAVLMASYALVMDFEDIKNGVDNGAPRSYAWKAAFGLTVTLVWLYIEILRILAILRGSN